MTPSRHLALGLLFLSVVGVLGYYTLFKADVSLFGEKQSFTAYAEDAGGLRRGAPVLYAGVRWGEVTEVAPEVDRPREQRVRLVVTLDEPIRLFGDHTLRIESASVLGGVQLSIDPGNPDTGELDTIDQLQARNAPDVLAALGQVVDENRDAIRNSFAGIESLVSDMQGSRGVLGRLMADEELGQTVANALDSIAKTFENAEAMTEEMRGGRGTLGKLIYDQDLFNEIQAITGGIQAFVDDARGLVSDARTGEGIVATLLNDGTAAGDLRTFTSSLSSVMTKIDTGEGTLSRLVNDGAIADSIQRAADQIASFTAGLADGEGQGSLGKFMNDPALYDNFLAVSQDLRDIAAQVRSGEGTVGQLIYDDAILMDLQQALRTLNGSLEEAREAAPITAFLSTLFLGF